MSYHGCTTDVPEKSYGCMELDEDDMYELRMQGQMERNRHRNSLRKCCMAHSLDYDYRDDEYDNDDDMIILPMHCSLYNEQHPDYSDDEFRVEEDES